MKSLDNENTDSENSFYIIFNNVDGYIIESNKDKCLIFASTDKNKKVLKKYTDLWDEIKNQIETINDGKCNFIEPIEYKKDFTWVKFKSNDDLPLNKILSVPAYIIVVGSVLQKDDQYYPQVYLHEFGYEFVNELLKVCNSCNI